MAESDTCNNQKTFLESSETAKALFDAAAKLKSNINNELLYNFNDYRKCLAYREDNKELGVIRGKYCMARYNSESEPEHYSGLCYPQACSNNVLDGITSGFVQAESKQFVGQHCYTHHVEWEIIDYVAVVFCALWAIIVVGSTIYDIVMTKKQKQNINKWLITFSLYSNVKMIFKHGESKNSINCLYAMRTISVLWLIIANRFRSSAKFPLVDVDDYNLWLENGFSTFIGASDAAFDTFFMISGFLLATYCLRAYVAQNMKYIRLLIHRYIRYTPLIIASVIYYISLFKFFVHGPLQYKLTSRVDNCKSNWWASIFLMENYIHPDKTCLYEGWYFSVDFQHFIILPILVLIFFKWRKFGCALLAFLVIARNVALFTLLYIYDTPYTLMNNKLVLSILSYFRCTPWIFSIILAYICLKDEGEIRMKKGKVIACWVSTCIIFIGYFTYYFFLQTEKYAGKSVIAGAIFASLARIMWSFAIGWVIFACNKLEYDGIVKNFLNSNKWKPLGKLSLTLFIVHPLYQMSTVYSTKVLYDFNSWWTFHIALGDILFTSIIALIFYGSIEVPFVLIEKNFFEGRMMPNEEENEAIELKVQKK